MGRRKRASTAQERLIAMASSCKLDIAPSIAQEHAMSCKDEREQYESCTSNELAKRHCNLPVKREAEAGAVSGNRSVHGYDLLLSS